VRNPVNQSLAPTGVDPRQYLTFTLGSDMFAVETLSVKEIIEYAQITAVPMLPASIRGVINLRGAVVPVIDLKARFGGQASETTRRTCIVIVEFGVAEEHQVIGIVVDAVSEVREIPAGDIEPPPAFGARIRADFISGMGKIDGHFVILLDMGCVLSIDELSALSGPSEQPPALALAA